MLTLRESTILGRIPSEWSRELLTSLLVEQRAGDWGDDAGDVPLQVLRSTNFTDRGVLNFSKVAKRYFTESKAEGKDLRKGDLLLERSGGGPTQPVGRVGFVSEDLPDHWFSNFVQLLRPDAGKVHAEFLGWLLVELNRSGVVERLQHQTTQMRNLDFRDYLRIYLPVPEPAEQQLIVEVLRRANDAITRGSEKLIAAQRFKSALLQQLFTRGVPSRQERLKETKVGDIPESWDVMKIMSVLEGPPFNGVSPQSRPSPPGTPILNVECVEDGICTTAHVSYVDVDEATQKECRAREGDFYVLRGNGNRNYVGRGGLLIEEPKVPTIFSDKLIRLRFRASKVAQRFIPYMWQSSTFLHRLQSKAECGSGLWMMGKRDIGRELLAAPREIEEQETIVAILDAAVANINSCQGEIHFLERVRNSLLQNLTSGKVRLKAFR